MMLGGEEGLVCGWDVIGGKMRNLMNRSWNDLKAENKRRGVSGGQLKIVRVVRESKRRGSCV